MNLFQLARKLESERIQKQSESFDRYVRRENEIRDTLEEIIDEKGLMLTLKAIAEICADKSHRSKNSLNKSTWGASELLVKRIVLRLASIEKREL